MCNNMLIQIRRIIERCSALAAFIWLFSTVRVRVYPQGILASEGLSTLLANVRLNGAVQQLVAVQLATNRKRLVANSAIVRLSAQMNVSMNF